MRLLRSASFLLSILALAVGFLSLKASVARHIHSLLPWTVTGQCRGEWSVSWLLVGIAVAGASTAMAALSGHNETSPPAAQGLVRVLAIGSLAFWIINAVGTLGTHCA